MRHPNRKHTQQFEIFNTLVNFCSPTVPPSLIEAMADKINLAMEESWAFDGGDYTHEEEPKEEPNK